jgi:hypothetical protein
MKTSELTGAALDWAVAICEHNVGWEPEGEDRDFYSTDWAQGGPILEREINRVQEITEGLWEAEAWSHTEEGPTPLIAAMRCYVASKFGNTVEIPNELAKVDLQ